VSQPAEVESAAPAATAADRRLLERLRAGDEAAFEELVAQYSGSLLRVALMYVPSRAVAEEVVQETWLGVIKGLDRFEGRSSLKTWIFRILVNRARTRGERESRTVPFATLAGREASESETLVDADRFLPPDHDQYPGHWATPPRRWEDSPERSLQAAETREMVLEAIDDLPEMQRLVITMRDIEGWSSAEVRNALDISETNQRVLLHRARTKVRNALEGYLA
jgi:RNA polymerase sigma-70 factor (ECF subfamily)